MLHIQALTGSHNRANFDCGNSILNEWLRGIASQHQQKKGLSKTFVAGLNEEPTKILGYYALTVCEVRTAELPKAASKRLPRIAPGIKLARLAIDLSMQSQGLGKLLLLNAVERSNTVSAEVGVHALFVDAIDADAAAFYRKYGFVPFPDQPLQLFLNLSQMR
jgi:GNAT superfamily N-acetyltransferase